MHRKTKGETFCSKQTYIDQIGRFYDNRSVDKLSVNAS